MTATLAIVHPTDLLGQELREQLARRHHLWHEIRLLAASEEEVGTVTSVGGAAALVQRFYEDSLQGVDLLFCCGPAAESRKVLRSRPGDLPVVLLSYGGELQEGAPVVAGVNLGDHPPQRILQSPHPVVVMLAHLLHPLGRFGLGSAVATLVEPASAAGTAALEEVHDQTRRLLSFQALEESATFGGQIAFNLVAAPEPTGPLARQLATVLDREGEEIALQVVRAGVFHSYAASLFVRLDDAPGEAAVREALEESELVRMVDDPEQLGPIDAAASDSVLVGAIRGQAAGYWIWAVMDNLTRGGAVNALRLAEALLR